ncbi:MAG: hypothetical protein PHO08_10085 [Methylococcales bacterium]|nr:hypothetical protein [Methylococcales bacterium]
MTTHKNTKQHKTIATLLLFSIGLLFSSNTFAWTHKIGDKYGGGIVFYVYDGGLHGLIAARADQSRGIRWYNGTYKYTGTYNDGVNTGAMNTAIIVATQINDTPAPEVDFAALLCADYSAKAANGVTYGDWYLPSLDELNLLRKQKYVVGGFRNDYYWSSTNEIKNKYFAWSKSFYDGDNDEPGIDSKNVLNPVRCIRAF